MRARATVRSLCLINQHYPCDGSDATRASVRAEAFATAMPARMSQSSTGWHKFPLSRARPDAIVETQ